MLSPRSLLPALAFAALLAGCPAEEKKCSAGLTMCLGNCVDAQTDATGCGAGCVQCPIGGSCIAGVCECPAGTLDCGGGACVDVTANPLRCGACDVGCQLGTCVDSACVCDVGADLCTGPGDQCVDFQTHTSNCGSCRHSCGVNEPCIAGSCQCLAPNLLCGTECVLAQTDEWHCGGCTTVCPTGATCSTGLCGCPPDYSVCGASPGVCVAKATDENNCGTCGNVCATNGQCVSGTCSCPPANPTLCVGTHDACVDLTTDPLHCGTCATACSAGKVCTSGTCCSAGQFVCGSAVKSCCNGTSCCPDGSCQKAHSNGLGQTFYDCNAVGTHTQASATAAANAWNAGTANYDMTGICGSGCYGRQTANSCAVWCYSGNLAGQVGRNDISVQCLCPPQGNVVGTWN
jgi:hypothetical protein